MSKSLYDEAIADARQLREVAEKNAKQAVVEAVTPKIRKFIEEQLISGESEKISNNREDSIVEKISQDRSEDIVLDESALKTLSELIDPSGKISSEKNMDVLNVFNESAALLGKSKRQKLLQIVEKLRDDSGTLSPEGIVIEQELNNISIKENSEMSRRRETLYEVDLNDIVSSLHEAAGEKEDLEEKMIREMLSEMDDEDLYEYDLFEQDEEDAPEDDAGADEVPPADDMDLGDLGELPPVDDGGGEGDLPEPVDAAMDDLEQAILDALTGGGAGEAADLEAGLADLDLGAEAPPEGEEEPEDLAETVDVDLNMLKSEIRRMKTSLSESKKPNASTSGTENGSSSTVKQENQKLRRAILNQGRNNRAMGSKLDEYRSAVQSLREQLTEMNLFNAKLLYVNKMLQNKDVSSSQRRSIIEALDSANSLREVKLLYKSLTESIGNKKSGRTLNESAVRRNLGSASRATKQASSTNNSVAEVSRWATLAGIN